MRPVRAACLLGALVVSACTTIERAALPEARLDPGPWISHAVGASETLDHGAWDRFLAAYRVAGADRADGIARLDYAAVTEANRGGLARYLARLERVDLGRLDRPEQLAFWINLYNAKTVEVVLDAYPTDSIRAIGPEPLPLGPWDQRVVRLGARPLSPNDIEHRIVRPIWDDPRVHYAFNCAAVGCPDLAPVAYTGANLDELLEASARAYVNDPRGFRFGGNRLVASKIYAWFVEDFGGTPAAVLSHAAAYAEPALAARLAAHGRIDA